MEKIYEKIRSKHKIMIVVLQDYLFLNCHSNLAFYVCTCKIGKNCISALSDSSPKPFQSCHTMSCIY